MRKDTPTDAEIRAADTLVHYFRLLAQRSGVNFDSDNEVEIREAVADIVKAAQG